MKKTLSLLTGLMMLSLSAFGQGDYLFHKQSLVDTTYLPFTVTNGTTLSWPNSRFVPVDLPYFGSATLGAIVQINTGTASNLVVTGQVSLDRDGDADAVNWTTVANPTFNVLGRNAETNWAPISLPGKKLRILSVQNTNAASVVVSNLDIGFWRPK